MKNEKHYHKINLREDDPSSAFINKRNWWKIILFLAMFIFLSPFLPTRFTRIDDFPKTGEEYWQKVTFISLLGALIILFLTWHFVIKPYLNTRKGYLLRGQFVVKQKLDLKKKLLLTPGTDHLIKVDRQFFEFINVGDKILVERRPLGEVVKVKKL